MQKNVIFGMNLSIAYLLYANSSKDISLKDYYSFGMVMSGRNFGGDVYRYGFNDKEKDSEVNGNGNLYDYGFRIYNPRLSRFLSVDPLTRAYPWYTPYQFAGNNPIRYADLDGKEQAYKITCTELWIPGSDNLTHTPPVGIYDKKINNVDPTLSWYTIGVVVAAPILIYGGMDYAPAAIQVVTSWGVNSLIWSNIPANQLIATQGAIFIAGVLYPGPEEIFPTSSSDEVGKLLGRAIRNIPRPTWKESEKYVGKLLDGGYDAQKSFKNINGSVKEVSYGTGGSSRPEYYNFATKHSIEVKNYDLTNSKGIREFGQECYKSSKF